MFSPLPYRYLVIEGNIGAGKTTLCQMLEQDFSAHLVLEQFTDNPFLPSFYEDRERFAFQVELFFMAERHRQLQDSLSQTNIFQPFIVGDYFFLKTLLFAKNNLKDDEYRLFSRLFNVLNTTFARPDLLLYIHRPVEVLLENIRKRARDFERDIDAAYLSAIQTAYLDYFKTQNQLPVVIVDFGDVDYTKEELQYHRIIDILRMPFSVGTHFLNL
ncbi:MAG: deoxynucleoside kinase [Saprospiraceae bacterium]